MRNCLDLAYFCCYPPMFKEKENVYKKTKKQTGSIYGCFEAGKKTIFINTLLKEQKMSCHCRCCRKIGRENFESI